MSLMQIEWQPMILELLAHVHVSIHGVHGAHRVRHRALSVLAALERGFDRRLEVAKIVHRIEDSENVDAVGCGALDEGFDDVVGIVPIAE